MSNLNPAIPHEESAGLMAVVDEMYRQDAKWGADRDQHDFTWSTILGEEFGEVCQAALHDAFGGDHAGTLRSELVQVAAVAIQWIEQLDRLDKKDSEDVHYLRKA